MSGCRYQVRRLEYHAVTVGERRRDLPGGDCDREVPWRDDADDPQRLARDVDIDVRAHGWQLLAGQPHAFRCEEQKDLRGTCSFTNAFGKRLALFTRQQT